MAALPDIWKLRALEMNNQIQFRCSKFQIIRLYLVFFFFKLPETEGATFQTLQCDEVTSSKWKRKLYTIQKTKLMVERMMVARARYLYLMVTSTPPALLSSSLWFILHALPESLVSPRRPEKSRQRRLLFSLEGAIVGRMVGGNFDSF